MSEKTYAQSDLAKLEKKCTRPITFPVAIYFSVVMVYCMMKPIIYKVITYEKIQGLNGPFLRLENQ